ncbi:MAG: UvrD-helicase domain-containing protein [Planctomycetota bacterium]
MDWFDVKDAASASVAGAAPSKAAATVSMPASVAAEVPVGGLLEGLNEAQRAAVVHGDGPLLIVAGPGSGKTRVVTSRIAHLVLARGVAPQEILALTFTNKAAREMRERVERVLPSSKGLWIGTFHGIAARILRRDVEALPGYTRDFTILDTADRNALLKTLVKDLGFDPKRYRPQAIGGWISARKNRAASPDGGLELIRDGAFDGGLDEDVFKKVEAAYLKRLPALNSVDFDDLLLLVLHLFEEHPGVRDGYARRFRHVLVDEYQDTNRVQYLIVRHLASQHGNLSVCGDPDQSIYGWRGADIRNILDFERDYANAAVVRLERNYRSTQRILDAANSVIRNNRARKQKELFTDPDNLGERLVVIECGDENDEAREIARQVQGFIAGGGKFAQCAVLYRANFMQRAIEAALRLQAVPYQVVAGLEFYQRREIKDLVAYLRLAVNPADDVAFVRAVNTPARGIGDTSLERLVAFAAARGLPLVRALDEDDALNEIRGRARSSLGAFRELVRRLGDVRELDAGVALDLVLQEIDQARWLAEMDEGDGVQDRVANVEELRAYADEFDRMHDGAGLRGFLQDIALVADADGGEAPGDQVRLMTLHAAKGLEFPFVVVAGVEEELLPHGRALAEALDESSVVEEERRLFYVGMTRAEKRLVLTHANYRGFFGGGRPASPSRYLDEIPRELYAGGGDAESPQRREEEEREALGAFDAAAVGLAVGDLVQHAHFGRGRIAGLVGSGVNARATVDFVNAGRKQLLLQYANLERLGR